MILLLNHLKMQHVPILFPEKFGSHKIVLGMQVKN